MVWCCNYLCIDFHIYKLTIFLVQSIFLFRLWGGYPLVVFSIVGIAGSVIKFDLILLLRAIGICHVLHFYLLCWSVCLIFSVTFSLIFSFYAIVWLGSLLFIVAYWIFNMGSMYMIKYVYQNLLWHNIDWLLEIWIKQHFISLSNRTVRGANFDIA